MASASRRALVAIAIAVAALICVQARARELYKGGKLRLETNPNPWGVRWLEGLPPRPSYASPDGPSWSNSVAICSVMKDEQLEDVQEWLRYYRWMGVDHIYLTDNGSEGWSSMRAALRAEFPKAFLSLRTEALDHAQLKVYAWCAETQRSNYDWLAFFDLDEYLVLRGDAAPRSDEEAPQLKAFLDGYKHTAALAVNWIWMGPSGRETRPEGGGVMRAYTQCVPKPDRHIKTIVNTFFLDGVAVHPHNFHYRDHMRTQTEHGAEIPTEWRVHPSCRVPHRTPAAAVSTALCHEEADSATPSHDFRQCCSAMAGAMTREGTTDRIALYHFATKSWQDFAAKMKRGSGMSKSKKTKDYFDKIAKKQTHEPICKEVITLWEACCSPKALGQQTQISTIESSRRSW